MRCAEIVTNYLLFQILFLFNAGFSFGEDQKIQHWSFVPPKPHTPPEVSDKSWLTNEIDNFILLKLEKNGLEPAAEASPHQLIRRVYYDLIGLPPDPDEVREYIQNPSLELYKKIVNRLLDSPQYGENGDATGLMLPATVTQMGEMKIMLILMHGDIEIMS